MAQARRATVILLYAVSLSAVGHPAIAGGAETPERQASRGKPGRGIREQALPDTVLATVGGDRVVTRSKFLNAWAQVAPPARPDSLTPGTAAEFLELLIGKEALGAAALRERWVWTPDESTQYRGLRDRLVMNAVLDSALEATRLRLLAAGDTIYSPQTLGVIARDSLVAGLDVRWDAPLLARLARAFAAIPRPSPDSSLSSQLGVLGALPHVDSADVARPVAEARTGAYTVAELFDAWRHLNPLYRPRIDSADQVRDLVRNGLYERELRRDAARRRIEERPDIAAALAREREFIAVNHLVAREVYARLAADSATLERYYQRHAEEWAIPLRVRLTRLVLPDRAAATRMALQLRDAAEAESLTARGLRGGVDYRVVVSEESDSALFRHALRAGAAAVLGPDSLPSGWAVARVSEIVPGRRRSFEEARKLASHAWYGEEGERLMVALLGRVKRATRIKVNAHALEHIRL